jgi:hypothetical protein
MAVPTKLCSSGVADVWDLHDGRVLKAFRSEPRAHGLEVGDINDHDLVTAAICSKEVKAYLKTTEIKELEPYIPEFFGQVDPCVVLTCSNCKYVAGAGFIIEKIDGKDNKVRELTENILESIRPISDVLANLIQPLRVIDASIFYCSENNFKLIDFAYWDYSEYQCQLQDGGRLTSHQKEELKAYIQN